MYIMNDELICVGLSCINLPRRACDMSPKQASLISKHPHLSVSGPRQSFQTIKMKELNKNLPRLSIQQLSNLQIKPI